MERGKHLIGTSRSNSRAPAHVRVMFDDVALPKQLSEEDQ